MTYTELDKILYQAMKIEAKKRKIKLSMEHDLYKKVDPYFFNVSYYIDKISEENIDIKLDISVKYFRYDELQYNIINPESKVHFTDKLRANSGIMCDVAFPRIVKSFDYDSTEKMAPKLCENILNFLEKYYDDFFTMVKKEYGNLGNYYIANRDKNPRLAGLAYLDKGDVQGAIECFLHPNMDGFNHVLSVDIHTDGERRRAQERGQKIFHTPYGESIHRRRIDQFRDYAIALQNGLEWTNERAMYGLLIEEHNGKVKDMKTK